MGSNRENGLNYDKHTSKKMYASRINRVVDYIKSHLDGDLSLETLAGEACFSKYYFHRLFKALTGETLTVYVARARVEKAAYLLLYNPGLPITTVAYDTGYSSPSVFSREFRQHYGMAPSKWRLQKKRKICQVADNTGKAPVGNRFYLEYSKHKPTWRPKMLKNSNLQIHVKTMPEITIAYLRHNGAYDPMDKPFFQSQFHKLMSWAIPLQLFNPPVTKALTIFSSGHPDTTAPENLTVDVAISLETPVTPTGEIGTRSIPAGQYAVVSLRDVTMQESAEAWNTLFSEWLPESGFQPGDGSYYIHHQNDPEQHPQKLYTLEMFLPVKPL